MSTFLKDRQGPTKERTILLQNRYLLVPQENRKNYNDYHNKHTNKSYVTLVFQNLLSIWLRKNIFVTLYFLWSLTQKLSINKEIKISKSIMFTIQTLKRNTAILNWKDVAFALIQSSLCKHQQMIGKSMKDCYCSTVPLKTLVQK